MILQTIALWFSCPPCGGGCFGGILTYGFWLSAVIGIGGGIYLLTKKTG